MKPKIIKSALLCFYCSQTLAATILSPEEINDLAIESGYPLLNIGVTGGTLGMGINVSKHINNFFSVRLNMNGMNITMDDTSLYHGNIDADKHYHLDTKGLLLDLHLKQLRFSVGAYINNNTMEYVSHTTVKDPMIINHQPYGPEAFGEIRSTIAFNRISPYLGVGWGNNSHHEGWSFTFDIGLMYHGNPSIDIEADVNTDIPVVAQNRIQSDLRAERKLQEASFTDFPFYPVVMIGMSYSF